MLREFIIPSNLSQQVAEKVLTEHVTVLRKNLYSQDIEILDRHCRPIEAIVLRCSTLLEQQEWGRLLADKIYLSEIKLGKNTPAINCCIPS